MGIIYKVTNIRNGKIYIGQTIKTLEKRKNAHINEAIRFSKLYFHKALKKEKDNFNWEVLEECTDNLLDEREIFWIDYFNSTNRKFGYNLTIGGTGGVTTKFLENKIEIEKKRIESIKESFKNGKRKPYRHLLVIWSEKFGEEEAKIKYEKLLKAKGLAISTAKLGKKYSDAHKKSISDSLKGRKLSEETIAKRRRPRPDREIPLEDSQIKLICELYQEKNYSLKAIEREIKINREKIKRILRRNNIEIKKRKN